MSRIFTNVEETHTLLTNLYQSLCRSDQDAWLRKVNLARQSSYGAFGSNANLLAINNNHNNNKPASEDNDDTASSVPDEKPIRGYSNVAALIAAASPNRNINGSNTNGVTSPSKKFNVGGNPRVTQALRLAGEDHSEAEETARPRAFAISCSRGAASRGYNHQNWFDELAAKKSSSVANNSKDVGGLLSLESAKQEFCEQEHFGLPNPGKEFENAVRKFAPLAQQRGGLNVDEFTCIFARFDYD